MKQFNDRQLCHQYDCKKFLPLDENQKYIVRCHQCHLTKLQEKCKELREQKQLLQIKKQNIEIELQKIYDCNQQQWNILINQNEEKVKEWKVKEKKENLQNNIRIQRIKLSQIREGQIELQQIVEDLNKQSQIIQKQYYEQKENLKQKDYFCKEKERLLKKRQYLLFCQLPFLFDNHLPYQYFKINEEINETLYDNFLNISQSFLKIDNSQSIFQTTLKKKEVCLTLKKSITKWNEYFIDNPQYFENFIQSLINVYKLIYYISNIFNIILPYQIYIDNSGYPQFILYEIFNKQYNSNMIHFKDSSLTQMQVNIYYIKYYLNLNISNNAYIIFDIMDLLQEIYLKLQDNDLNIFDHLIDDYGFKNKIELQTLNGTYLINSKLPIKLIQVQNTKFLLNRPIDGDNITKNGDTSENGEFDSDDVEFID